MTQRKKSISAVQIPDGFTVRVCYVTLALTALALTPTSLYVSTSHGASGQRDAAERGKLLLTSYQFSSVRIPIEYVVVLRGARLAVL